MSSHNADGGGRGIKYPQVVRMVAETPWAIVPAKLHAILELVAMRASGERFTDEEVRDRIGAAPRRNGGAGMAGSVAVLPLYGTITPKAGLFSEISGATSVQGFQAMFREALNDQQVSAIVIDIDSPGGMVDLVPELAAEIRGARGKKPIVAVANTLAASAAYWLGSQADEFVVTPSGEVGSIGVFAAHTDVSAAQEMAGLKTTLISAGKFKTELSPFQPLSEEAVAALQARINDSYGMFVGDVAKGRKVPVEQVRSGFGEGRVVTAKQALAEGMVDRIDTLEATVTRMQRTTARAGTSANANYFTATATNVAGEFILVPVPGGAQPPGDTDDTTHDQAAASGLSFADEASAVRDAAAALVDRLSSLAEVERGRLTAAKREALTPCAEQLREAAEHIESVLAATNPHKATLELLKVQFEQATR